MIAAAPAAAEPVTEVSGQLADSTPYRFIVPEDWNGTVFVELDFAASPTLSAAVEPLSLMARRMAGRPEA